MDYSTALLSLPFFYSEVPCLAPNLKTKPCAACPAHRWSLPGRPAGQGRHCQGAGRAPRAAVDTRSDIDLYVYTEAGDYPLDQRRAIIERLGGASRPAWG